MQQVCQQENTTNCFILFILAVGGEIRIGLVWRVGGGLGTSFKPHRHAMRRVSRVRVGVGSGERVKSKIGAFPAVFSVGQFLSCKQKPTLTNGFVLQRNYLPEIG
jgi:hypothetical protein